jgi:hypothetical protein
LSQILFFKIVQLSTCTKPIGKDVFINYIQIMVVQLLNSAIVKGNYIFLLILNDKKVYLWENRTCNKILQSAIVFLKWFK